MVNILITTQYLENYGSADQPYWKFKGGEDYIFSCDIKMNEFLHKNCRVVVDSLLPHIEYKNEYTEEYMVGWEIVSSDYKTESEILQERYEGEILYPAKRYDVDAFLQEQQPCA